MLPQMNFYSSPNCFVRLVREKIYTSQKVSYFIPSLSCLVNYLLHNYTTLRDINEEF